MILISIDDIKQEVLNGNISEKKYADLSIFTYTQQCVYEKNWNPTTLQCRGLVWDNNRKEVRAWCLPKFFNIFENGVGLDDLPNEEFEIYEKVDGSYIGAFFYEEENRWMCVTKGSFDSEQSRWATDWLNRYEPPFMNRNHTYIFEAVYPENKVVVDYNGVSELVYITSFDKDGYELDLVSQADRELFDRAEGFRSARLYHYNDIKELICICEKDMDHNSEGFVVKYPKTLDSPFRVKIKSDEYVRIHRLISKITPLGVWYLMINNQGWNEEGNFKISLPEEILQDYKNIRRIIGEKTEAIYQHTFRSYAKIWKKVYKIKEIAERRKRFVEIALKDYGDIFKYLILIYDNKPEQGIRAMILRDHRPNGNKLDGYTPCSMMNRFLDKE